MRTLFILFLLIIGFCSALHVSAEPEQGRDQLPYLTKEFKVAHSAELNVKALGGNISVEGHDSNNVKVEVFVRPGLKAKFAENEVEEALKAYELQILQEGNRVTATVEKKGLFRALAAFAASSMTQIFHSGYMYPIIHHAH